MLKLLGKFILNLIYPEVCCGCGKVGSLLCRKCVYQVDFVMAPFQLPESSVINSLTVAFHYKFPISNLIQAMKYQSVVGAAHALGEFLYLHTNYPDAEVVTSVPLLKEKERLRGFNQAREMARIFSQRSGIPFQEILQKQTIHQTSQASLHDRQARLQNVDPRAFTVVPTARAPTSVILIDDVFTTGATLNACAKALKKAGVQQVHGLVVAHGR